MKKLIAVFKREYLAAVRKKMFIIMTFLLPLLMAGIMVLPGMLMMRGMGEKKVAVVDATGQLRTAFVRGAKEAPPKPKLNGDVRQREQNVPTSMKIEYADRKEDDQLEATVKNYLGRLSQGTDEQRLDAVFVVPADAMTNPDAHFKYYSRSATDFITQERLTSIARKAIHRYRLSSRGVAPGDIDTLLSDLQVDSMQISKSGEEKKGGAANFYIGFVLTALLFIPSFTYGLEIMRGIIQEKTDRVVEVLISSMTPTQLLIGKITGTAAVGLTQIAVWLLMLLLAGTFGVATATMAGMNLMQFIRPMTFVYFVLFFVLAYLTYVCVYAVAGAICNSDKEAQQMIGPITMIMMLPWFLLVAIITNPDSPVAVGFSLSPVFGPMTMYIRTLVAEPPIWHIAVSVLVSIATIAVFFWATAKIFRVGILSYGKRPTIPELWRWIKVA